MRDPAFDLTEDYAHDLEVFDLGTCKYEKAWKLQQRLQQSLIRGIGIQSLLLCEHCPVLTFGKSADPKNLLATDNELRELGVERYAVERGGDYTYHGPGQLVVYPLIDLRVKKRDVGWYMRTLELVVIDTLQVFGIRSFQISGKTGVWTSEAENDTQAERDLGEKPRKIASIGVRLSRWCTMHGLSLNVSRCAEGFRLIHPCGLSGIEMTSMHDEKVLADISEVKDVLVWAFCRAFDFRYVGLSKTIDGVTKKRTEHSLAPTTTDNLAVNIP